MTAQQIVTRDQIAASLKDVRESRGKNRAQLGRAAGVHPRLICYWEKGRGKPSITAAIKIADALGMSLDRLFRKKKQGKERSEESQARLPELPG